MELRAKSRASWSPITVAATVLAALFMLGLFGLDPFVAADGYTPHGSIEPNPALAGNLTISTHANGWAPLEYTTSTGGIGNLSAEVDTKHNTNPYSVTPTSIIAQTALQGNKIGTALWNHTQFWSAAAIGGGDAATGPTAVTVNGASAIQGTINTTAAHQETGRVLYSNATGSSVWPSSNLQFDYVTIGFTVSGGACPGGGNCFFYPSIGVGSSLTNCYLNRYANNGTVYAQTGAPSSSGFVVSAGSSYYASISLQQITNTCAAAGTQFQFNLYANLAIGASVVYTIVVTELALTTQAMTLGTTTWAKLATNVGAFTGAANLSVFSPTFTWTSVAGGGFSVATIQYASDLPGNSVNPVAVTTATLANGSAQITYNFGFGFPTAPSLVYGTFALKDIPYLQPWQYSSVTFAGSSYLTTYQSRSNTNNYTTVLSSASPTTAANWVGTMTYTGAQWDTISAPPGVFSANGIEYIWFALLSAILAIGGASSAWVVRNQRQLRNRMARQPIVPTPIASLIEGLRRSRRRLHRDRQGKMEGRHHAALTVGLIFLGASLVAGWAVFTGADTLGVSAAFIGALIVFLAIFAIGFGIYEVWHYSQRRHHHG